MSAARSHVTVARDREHAARARLDEAELTLATATARAQAARETRVGATVSTTPKQLAAMIADEQTADAHLAICRNAHAEATATLEAAMHALVHGERADTLALQHQRGVLPIIDIEREVQRLAKQIDALRAKQLTLFAVEVAPRAPSWYRAHALETPPTGAYESLGHLLALHYVPEPPRAATAIAPAPALVAEVA